MTAVDRRATCARCFVFGDIRSVETTLEMFDSWRDPADPSRRVETLVLSGDPVHVFATAEGIRDLERMRGGRFGFSLRAAVGSLSRPFAHAFTDAKAPANGAARTVVLMVDADECIARTPAGRRAITAMERFCEATDAPVVLVLNSGVAMAGALAARLLRGHRIDVVRYDGNNPFLLPALEGMIADHAPDQILVGGRGRRVVSTAIGAGDYFLERGGDPTGLTRAARHALIARATCVAQFLVDAPSMHRFDVAAALRDIDVPAIDGAFDDERDGVLVHPLASGT